MSCTNLERQVAVVTKLCTVCLMFEYSVRNLLRVTIKALRILRWCLDFLTFLHSECNQPSLRLTPRLRMRVVVPLVDHMRSYHGT
jgi:hypothetical protein